MKWFLLLCVTFPFKFATSAFNRSLSLNFSKNLSGFSFLLFPGYILSLQFAPGEIDVHIPQLTTSLSLSSLWELWEFQQTHTESPRHQRFPVHCAISSQKDQPRSKLFTFFCITWSCLLSKLTWDLAKRNTTHFPSAKADILPEAYPGL